MFVSQGCLFKHEMPDRGKLKELGFSDVPRWWREKTRIMTPTWMEQRLKRTEEKEVEQPRPYPKHDAVRGLFREMKSPDRSELGLECTDTPRPIESKEVGRLTPPSPLQRTPTTTENLIDLDPPHTTLPRPASLDHSSLSIASFDSDTASDISSESLKDNHYQGKTNKAPVLVSKHAAQPQSTSVQHKISVEGVQPADTRVLRKNSRKAGPQVDSAVSMKGRAEPRRPKEVVEPKQVKNKPLNKSTKSAFAKLKHARPDTPTASPSRTQSSASKRLQGDLHQQITVLSRSQNEKNYQQKGLARSKHVKREASPSPPSPIPTAYKRLSQDELNRSIPA